MGNEIKLQSNPLFSQVMSLVLNDREIAPTSLQDPYVAVCLNQGEKDSIEITKVLPLGVYINKLYTEPGILSQEEIKRHTEEIFSGQLHKIRGVEEVSPLRMQLASALILIEDTTSIDHYGRHNDYGMVTVLAGPVAWFIDSTNEAFQAFAFNLVAGTKS
ncbi:MAG: hypothetical protein KDK66_08415 [Deltaproteobacteria bacterium]|nr:hypothetical protein [Deltaproteobacteria bacterium]